MKRKQVFIFDTTLRDGEQSPGASLNVSEKYEIAKQLARLGVDIIEAGFPITSRGDFEAVELISRKLKGPVICALARANKLDIKEAAMALKPAKKKRIHVFISASEIHLQYQLRKSRGEVIDLATKSVKFAKRFADDIEFSAMDATRSDWDYLKDMYTAAIEAGATTINIPDTVGYTVPAEFARLISFLKENVSNIKKAVISVHCHNDLGLAVANSLAAIEAGARQVECTVNGIGERAGNASMEEIVMAINTRKDFYAHLYTGIKTKEIYRTSLMVRQLTGIPVQPNKAIVGANAFAHESGIHQDGMLKHHSTYEIMTSRSIGIPSSQLILGKHSGRHAFRQRLKEMGYSLTEKEIARAFVRFKELADKKKEVHEEDLVALITDEIMGIPEAYTLEYLSISSGNMTVPTATVRLKNNGRAYQEAACGDGPVDAAYKAIDRITKLSPKLIDYRLKALTGGKDAQGEVVVRVQKDGQTYQGRGLSTDILEASVRAYLNAINKVIYLKGKRQKKPMKGI